MGITFSAISYEMGCTLLADRQDLIQGLARLDMRHILDHIFSYLDMETINRVEKVSPLWAWLVESSNSVYKKRCSLFCTGCWSRQSSPPWPAWCCLSRTAPETPSIAMLEITVIKVGDIRVKIYDYNY